MEFEQFAAPFVCFILFISLLSLLSCFVSHFAYFVLFSAHLPLPLPFPHPLLLSPWRINIMLIFMIFIMFHYVAFYDSCGRQTKRMRERGKREKGRQGDWLTWPGHISAVCGYGCGYTMHSVRFSSNLWHVCLLFPPILYCCFCCCYCCYLLLGAFA